MRSQTLLSIFTLILLLQHQFVCPFSLEEYEYPGPVFALEQSAKMCSLLMENSRVQVGVFSHLPDCRHLMVPPPL